MTIKAIIEMMDKLGFSNTAKHRVSYDLLESSMYIPVDREGSSLSKVLDMVNIEEILKSTPLDSYERISPPILSGIVNKFAKYQLHITELTIVLKQNVWLVRISHPSN